MIPMNREERAERRRMMISLVVSGDSIADVAEVFGVAPDTVYRAMRASGQKIVPGRHLGLRYVTSLISIIAQLQNSTKTYDKIADEFGLTKQRIGQIAQACQAAGIILPVRPRGPRPPSPPAP